MRIQNEKLIELMCNFVIIFQNLPELRVLDLSFNKLKSFDFDYFDQIGTLSHLMVNASYNLIQELSDNSSANLNTEQGK